MPRPADDPDDDIDEREDDDEVVLLNGGDWDQEDEMDEDQMENRIELKEDRTQVKDGERADDDRAAEALKRENEEEAAQAARDELDELAARQDELLDEGVEETFPASDPVSVKRIT